MTEYLDRVRMPRAPSGVGVQPDTCLYYPYFSVRDEAWLKQILVWWDQLATIVPLDVPLASVADGRFQALAEAGALQAWPVDLHVREAAARAVLDLIDQGKLAEFPEGDPFELRFGKMTHELVDELRRRDQVISVEGENVLLPGNTGFLVMAILAQALAEGTGAWPLTDEQSQAEAYVAIARGEPEGGPGARVAAGLQLMKVDLELTVPNLESVDLAAWLKFRDKHRSDLAAYRRSVKKLARDIALAPDRDVAQEVLSERKEQVQAEMEDRRSLFKRLTSDSALVALSFLVDLGVVAFNPALGAAISVAATGPLVAKQVLRREIHHLSFLTKAARRFG